MSPINEIIDFKDFPVLYIDDLADNLTAFKNGFEDDFTIFLSQNAKDAFNIMEKGNIALVIADQKMPEMTGVEFFKNIIDKYPHTIRILMTAYSDIDSVIEAINAGKVHGYISKPIENRDLRERIKSGIYTYHLEKERDRLYQEKLDAMKKLAHANRLNAVISMSSGFADRLNNYLVAINLFFDTFPSRLEQVGPALSNESKEILKALYYPSKNDVNKMLKLSGEISSFCRTPKYNFQKKSASDIINIADELIKELRDNIEEKKIKVNKRAGDNLPEIFFDRNSVKQIIYHILRNSIYALHDNGKGFIDINISGPVLRNGRPFVKISVEDNGCGIPEKDVDNIFNPFFTTKGTSGGLGLGLTTCQFIVSHHDGDIELEKTQTGGGTIISFYLPVKDSPPENVSEYNFFLEKLSKRT